MFSSIGHSCNLTIKARDVLKCGPHLDCPGCKYIIGEVATRSGHSKECEIRIMVEMEKDETKHRGRKWYVAKGIDERKVSFKDYHEGRASEGNARKARVNRKPFRRRAHV